MMAAVLLAWPVQAQQSGCRFVLGFAALRDQAGVDVIGDCLEDQAFAENGDARQRTTKGELVWRKADNRTAFTSGYETWISSPLGVQKRLNSERFPREEGAWVGGQIENEQRRSGHQ